MNYTPIIGLEIHCELKTKSKMFCSCPNGLGLEKEPNIHICPVCTGQPGTLPVPNEQAIEYVIKAGLALNCHIPKQTRFDRKNYFYPDLPKGYQISQYEQPLCQNGYILLQGNKKIKITRIHLEEDTGKLNHELQCENSLVDFNRAGVPLMELVTEPGLRSSEEAKKFCQELQKILRYIEISDADMEKGQMRCEANISLLPEDMEEKMENLGTKVEIKNLNSFRSIQKAIEYEIKRQTQSLKEGKPVTQETRGWDEAKQITYPQRVKEGAADYRYFPEPDIPPITLCHDEKCNIHELCVSKIKTQIPELPAQKKLRFLEEYEMDPKDADIIITDKSIANYTEQMVSELAEWFSSLRKKKSSLPEWKKERKKITKIATGWLVSKLFKLMKDHKTEIDACKITPENFAELMMLMYTKQINSQAGQMVLEEMFVTGADPEHVIQEKNLTQLDDADELQKIIEKVIQNNPLQIKEYKNGKPNVIQFLLGQVMKESKGKANPKKTLEILKKNLD